MNRIGFMKRLTMPLPELEAYYRQRREERFQSDKLFRGIYWRRAGHPLMIAGLKMKHILCGQKVNVIGDKRKPINHPVIYAATHIGWDDIEMVFSAIKTHVYLLLGDPRNLYRTMEGLLLNFNGVIYVDTDENSDRHIAKETCVQWLGNGNLLIFPEGAWNITESLPVMKLFNGAAEMAIRTGAEIIPVAIEQDGKSFWVNIGANIDCFQYSLEKKRRLTECLRDALATLRWEIWETRAVTPRAGIAPDYYEEYLKDIEDKTKNTYAFTLADNETACYHDKCVSEPGEVFAYLEKLEPCEANAFCFGGMEIR